ncbi:MAG: threonine ammonia-lyase [Candidatus Heimdallarchaeota archaeon]
MVNIQAIEKAREKIQSFINETPLLFSEYFSTFCDGQIFLKLENQQITNSFKIRGALNKMLNLSIDEKEKGVLAVSSGNHAQAVGVVAEQLGISAKIIIPKSTPQNKIDKIRKYKVELVLEGNNYDEAEVFARNLAKEESATFVSGYNDELVVAGQGTIGLELLEQQPSITDVLVPLGGGGLLSGIAIAIKSKKPDINIIGVQTSACPAFYESLKVGKIIDVEMKESIADGMYGGIELGSITFDIIKQYVDEVILVEEESIRKALALIWDKESIRVEGAAAAAIAPILENKSLFKDRVVTAVMTGGNIDDNLFQEIIKDTLE